jgi:hypothetical protein
MAVVSCNDLVQPNRRKKFLPYATSRSRSSDGWKPKLS